MRGLQGKTAVVTGAAAERSIGRSIALRLAEEGVNLILNDMNAEALEEVCRLARAKNVQAFAVCGDVSKAETARRLTEAALDQFGRLDILVNNAGITQAVSILDITEENWDKVQSVNLKSVFLCTRAVLEPMMKQGSGRIVNISSIAGRNGGGSFGGAHYSASKAGIIGFTRAVAREVGKHGITVNSIAPGSIDTDMFKGQSNKDGLSPEELKEFRARRSELKRLADASEVASVAAFLCSDDASYMTGAVLDVNGGIFMG